MDLKPSFVLRSVSSSQTQDLITQPFSTSSQTIHHFSRPAIRSIAVPRSSATANAQSISPTKADRLSRRLRALTPASATFRQTDSRQTDSRQTDSRQTDSRQTDSRQTDFRQTTFRQTSSRSIALPPDAMVNVKQYGAKGDGVTDDTAAIQRALNDERIGTNGQPLHAGTDFYGRPKALFFPTGTYLVSNTLRWIGAGVTLQGQGSEATVIRLKDDAIGFDNPALPKAVIETPSGNASFRQNIWNLSVDTGRSNPSAIGIDYIANNVASMRDVTIRSADSTGFAGLAMDRRWPGPCLIKNVQIDGFDYGMRTTHSEYGPTLENIQLNNQRLAGIHNLSGVLSIRNLVSNNRVPAILGADREGMVTLIDANLQGGAANVSAIDTQGPLYARNVRSSGYQSAIRYKNAVVPGNTQTEYTSSAHQLFDGPKRSLNLPIKDTPEYADANLNNWGKFQPRYYGDTESLQSLLNSGKSTIYFPFGRYFSYDERTVRVPASVKRIVGFSSVVNSDPNGVNGGGIKFVVTGNSTEPLIIEQFGYGVKIENRSSRPLAIKDGKYTYTETTQAQGDLFLENTLISPLHLRASRNVWARQLNSESLLTPSTKIQNSSANLWILGLKTEGKGTVIHTTQGAKTEVLGGVVYPVQVFSEEDRRKPAFDSQESNMSLVYRLIAYGDDRNYRVQVREVRNGVQRMYLSSQLPPQILYS